MPLIIKPQYHGYSRTKIYACWNAMMYRCTNPKSKVFKYYGGRGIKVCARWFIFLNFLSDMGEGKKGWSIERIDNEKGYDIWNCCWATSVQQSRNERNTLMIEFRDFKGPFIDACVYFGVNYAVAAQRRSRGESLERIFSSTMLSEKQWISKWQNNLAAVRIDSNGVEWPVLL